MKIVYILKIFPKILGNKNIKYATLDMIKNATLHQKNRCIYPTIGSAYHLPFKTQSISTMVVISSVERIDNDLMTFKDVGRVLINSVVLVSIFSGFLVGLLKGIHNEV